MILLSCYFRLFMPNYDVREAVRSTAIAPIVYTKEILQVLVGQINEGCTMLTMYHVCLLYSASSDDECKCGVFKHVTDACD